MTITEIRSCLYAGRDYSSKAPPFVFSNYHIEEQTQQKFQDDCLVTKVEKLESAVKDLTDDDGENRFTIDELAVILDMNVDEIRDILRLTGDDK